jgi:hypothetical protein
MYLQCTGSVHHPSPPVIGGSLEDWQFGNDSREVGGHGVEGGQIDELDLRKVATGMDEQLGRAHNLLETKRGKSDVYLDKWMNKTILGLVLDNTPHCSERPWHS